MIGLEPLKSMPNVLKIKVACRRAPSTIMTRFSCIKLCYSTPKLLLVSAERLVCLPSLETSHYIAYWGLLSFLDKLFPKMLVYCSGAFSTIQKTAGQTMN